MQLENQNATQMLSFSYAFYTWSYFYLYSFHLVIPLLQRSIICCSFHQVLLQYYITYCYWCCAPLQSSTAKLNCY